MKLLSEETVNRQITEMWDAVLNTDNDKERSTASEQATAIEKRLRESLAVQRQTLSVAWEALSELSPNDPLVMAQNIKQVFHQLVKVRGRLAELLQYVPYGSVKLMVEHDISDIDGITINLIQTQKPIVNPQIDSPMV